MRGDFRWYGEHMLLLVISALRYLLLCPHRRLTWPLTPPPGHGCGAAWETGAYVACLQCGQEFPYDIDQMQVLWPGEMHWRKRNRETQARQAELCVR
jgi:hypothetical protein